MQSDNRCRRVWGLGSASVIGMVFVTGSVIAVASTVTERPLVGVAALLAQAAGGLAVTVLGLRSRRADRLGDTATSARFGYASLLAALSFTAVVGALSWQSLIGLHRMVGTAPLIGVCGSLGVIGTSCMAMITLANLAQADPSHGGTSPRPPGAGSYVR